MPNAQTLSDDDLKRALAAAKAGDSEMTRLLTKLTPEERERMRRLPEARAIIGVDVPEPDLSGAPAPIRFMVGVARSLNPVPLAVGLTTAPIETVKHIGQAQLDEWQKAQAAPTFPEAIGHAIAGALPLIGPSAARTGERIASGDIAGGLGETAAMLAPFPGVRQAIKAPIKAGLRLLPEAAAEMAETTAARRLTDVAGPKLGPNKARLTQSLKEAAPDVLREPGLGALSPESLHRKVAVKLADAGDALDQAADARLVSQQVKTGPLLAALDDQIAKLVAQPTEASKFPRTLDQTGQPVTEPIGKAVEPQPNSTELATLRQIRSEVAALGPVAPYESIRRIRFAWDKVARVKYVPSSAADLLKAQGDATGAEKGTYAMRQALAATDPATAEANARYHLFRSVDDVLQARQEAEQARPRVGRTMLAGGAGAIAGSAEAGAKGALLGSILGPAIDRAQQLGPTFQIYLARQFQAMADAIRGQQPNVAQQIWQRTLQQFPTTKQGLVITGSAASKLANPDENSPMLPP